ncbi:MAG: catalase-related domain-containing protein, partial [Gaiellaceae bacterium]
DYAQAGERYRTMPDWERDDLVLNLVDLLGQCEPQIQVRMIEHFAQCDPDYARRVAEGLGRPTPSLEPAASATRA